MENPRDALSDGHRHCNCHLLTAVIAARSEADLIPIVRGDLPDGTQPASKLHSGFETT